jgi:hypothetical protein
MPALLVKPHSRKVLVSTKLNVPIKRPTGERPMGRGYIEDYETLPQLQNVAHQVTHAPSNDDEQTRNMIRPLCILQQILAHLLAQG